MKPIVFLLLSIGLCSLLQGQDRLKTPTLSPLTTITQGVGLSEITLTYSRPSAKGREIFGELVPYGEVWRTAANASSKITLTEAVEMGGQNVPAGTYALYTIPGPSTWTIIVHKNLTLRSLAGGVYKQEDDLCRFEVPVMPLSQMVETFTMQFADFTFEGCNLSISWEYTRVLIPIKMPVREAIQAQAGELFADPEKASDRNYFSAAQFYLDAGMDLNQALDWIDLALAKSPENFRYALLKSKILHKQGKKEAALSTVEEAHEMAKAANNANYMEQTRLYRDQIKGD